MLRIIQNLMLDEGKGYNEKSGHTLILWDNGFFMGCHKISMMDHTNGIPRCLNLSELFKMNIFGYLERHTEIYIVNIFIYQSVVTAIGGYFWK